MNIEELKRLAEAATPGPWEYTHAGRGDNGKFLITEYFVFIDDEDTAIAACILDPKTSRPSKGNAAYIAAANPAAILELIRQRDELLAALKEARELVDGWGAYASNYMQEKHDLAGDLERLDAAITKGEK